MNLVSPCVITVDGVKKNNLMSNMKKYIDNLLFKDCYIEPFDNLQGKIIGINFSKMGITYQVRYFLNGEYRIDDFFEFDISIIKDD